MKLTQSGRDNNGWRFCNKCRKERPATEDFFYSNGRGGLMAVCKVCRDGNLEQRRAHYDAYAETLRAKSNNYRARKLAADGTYTSDDIHLLFKSQKGLCWWCGKKVGKKYHIDHRIPLSRGGTNWPNNLCIACPSCNSRKRDRLPHEWNGRLL